MHTKGLFDSREKCHRRVLCGDVFVEGEVVTKPGKMFRKDVLITLKEKPPYMSRGGFKLEKALEVFGTSPRDKTCLDIGSSTGGFTDCLLQRGATKVYAVDTGTNQIDSRLRDNPKVILMENTNARYLTEDRFHEKIDLITVDVSFISAYIVVEHMQAIIHNRAEVIVLIKPQFEAGYRLVPKGGVLKDKKIHYQTLLQIKSKFQNEMHCYPIKIDFSPITGRKGNIEYFFHFALTPITEVIPKGDTQEDSVKQIVTEAFLYFENKSDPKDKQV